MESKFGRMELNTKGFGKKIKLLGKESFTMLTEMFLKANGKMIRLMDLGFIDIVMVQFIKVAGSKISSMGTALKLGLTTPHMLVCTRKGKNKEEASINGPMVVIMMAIG